MVPSENVASIVCVAAERSKTIDNRILVKTQLSFAAFGIGGSEQTILPGRGEGLKTTFSS